MDNSVYVFFKLVLAVSQWDLEFELANDASWKSSTRT